MFAEFWLRRKIPNRLNVVRDEVQKAMEEMKNIEVSPQMKANYENFRKNIGKCLKIDPARRPNFLEIFANNLD